MKVMHDRSASIRYLSACPANEQRLDPLMQAIMNKLPPVGLVWSVQDRILWLRLLSLAVQMIYGGPEIMISVAGIEARKGEGR